MNLKPFKVLTMLAAVAMLSSCGNSITKVWDYYVKNNVEVHTQNGISISKAELLYRKTEKVNKSQLEFVAFKQDSMKYLVIGSHKVAKHFYINDSLYSFDVTNLYSKVRGDDFIRQMGDLSIYFTHIPYESIEKFMKSEAEVNSAFKASKQIGNETIYIDYQLSPTVIVSFPKNGNGSRPNEMVLWVGRRKHNIDMSDFMKTLKELKEFK